MYGHQRCHVHLQVFVKRNEKRSMGSCAEVRAPSLGTNSNDAQVLLPRRLMSLDPRHEKNELKKASASQIEDQRAQQNQTLTLAVETKCT